MYLAVGLGKPEWVDLRESFKSLDQSLASREEDEKPLAGPELETDLPSARLKAGLSPRLGGRSPSSVLKDRMASGGKQRESPWLACKSRTLARRVGGKAAGLVGGWSKTGQERSSSFVRDACRGFLGPRIALLFFTPLPRFSPTRSHPAALEPANPSPFLCQQPATHPVEHIPRLLTDKGNSPLGVNIQKEAGIQPCSLFGDWPVLILEAGGRGRERSSAAEEGGEQGPNNVRSCSQHGRISLNKHPTHPRFEWQTCKQAQAMDTMQLHTDGTGTMQPGVGVGG